MGAVVSEGEFIFVKTFKIFLLMAFNITFLEIGLAKTLSEKEKALARYLFSQEEKEASAFITYAKDCSLESLERSFSQHHISNEHGYKLIKALTKRNKKVLSLLDSSGKSAFFYAVDSYISRPELRQSCEDFVQAFIKELDIKFYKEALSLLLKNSFQTQDGKKDLQLAEVILQEITGQPQLKLHRTMEVTLAPYESLTSSGKPQNTTQNSEKNESKKPPQGSEHLVDNKFNDLSSEDVLKKYKVSVQLGVKMLDNLNHKQNTWSADVKGKYIFSDTHILSTTGTYYYSKKSGSDKYVRKKLKTSLKAVNFFREYLSLILDAEYRDSTKRENSVQEGSASLEAHKNDFFLDNLSARVLLGANYSTDTDKLGVLGTLGFQYNIEPIDVNFFAEATSQVVGHDRTNYEVGFEKEFNKSFSIRLIHEDFYSESHKGKAVEDYRNTAIKFKMSF